MDMAFQNLRQGYGLVCEDLTDGEEEFARLSRAQTIRRGPHFYSASSPNLSVFPPHIEELPEEIDLSKDFPAGEKPCIASASEAHLELANHGSAGRACWRSSRTPPTLGATIDDDFIDNSSTSGESDSSSATLIAYEVLGVATDATRHAVKKAFKSKVILKERRAKADSDEACEKVQNDIRLLEDVYKTLRDSTLRAANDKLIGLSTERPDSQDEGTVTQVDPVNAGKNTAQTSALAAPALMVEGSSTLPTIPEGKPLGQTESSEPIKRPSGSQQQMVRQNIQHHGVSTDSRQHQRAPKLQPGVPPRARDIPEPERSLQVSLAIPSGTTALVPIRQQHLQQIEPHKQLALVNRQTQLQQPALRDMYPAGEQTTNAALYHTRIGFGFPFPPFHTVHGQGTPTNRIAAGPIAQQMMNLQRLDGRQVACSPRTQMLPPACSQLMPALAMPNMSMVQNPSFTGFGQIDNFAFAPSGTLTMSRTQTNVVVNGQTGMISGLQQSDTIYRDANGNVRMEQDRKEFTRR